MAPSDRQKLPIDPRLPSIVEALERAGAVVVVAPPGSGKTTRIPPALWATGVLGEGVCWTLEPRRVATRAAARRVADENGWVLGREVGYRVRFDRKGTDTTRLWFVTEGVLTARLQTDPSLEGISALVLDEFHERSLDADLALAFLREVREAFRPDLKVVVCSATLDPGPVAAFLGAEIVEAPGEVYPLEVRYQGHAPNTPLEERAARAVRSVWDHRPGGRGDTLVFLPGAREIRRTAERLAPWFERQGVRVLPLHGDLPSGAQDTVLQPDPAPRVILATNVAETSLTIPGVTTVVDSGFARQLRHDPSRGIDCLDTVPISRASADQRAGRAAREGPGLAVRLWSPHDDRARAAFTPPEIERVDLAAAVLAVLAWGAADPRRFEWYEPPAEARIDSAVALLADLGAVGPTGGLTLRGRALRRLPLHPRLGTVVLETADLGHLCLGARAAALLSERDLLETGRAFGPRRDLPTGPSDLETRLDLLEEAHQTRFDVRRCRGIGVHAGAARRIWRSAEAIERAARRSAGECDHAHDGSVEPEQALCRALLAGFPDRVARRRDGDPDRFVLVGGRGARLDRSSAVRQARYVIALQLGDGRGKEAVIRWAHAVESGALDTRGPVDITVETSFVPASGRVEAVERRTYRGLALTEHRVPPDPDRATDLLTEATAKDPEGTLAPGAGVRTFLARCRFLARTLPDLELPAWSPDEWATALRPLAHGKTTLAQLRDADLAGALRNSLTWEQRRDLDRYAPLRARVPTGRELPLAYPDDAPPTLAVKIQEVFGWRQGPRVADGRVPVVLHLLGPHGRPLQVTADLESFWQRGYPEIRKEMRGRYPKHRWPEDPWNAAPTTRTTKPRPAR